MSSTYTNLLFRNVFFYYEVLVDILIKVSEGKEVCVYFIQVVNIFDKNSILTRIFVYASIINNIWVSILKRVINVKTKFIRKSDSS